MVMHDTAVACVVNHALVDFIDTTAERFDESASTDDGIETKGDAVLLQFAEYEFSTEFLLLGNIAVCCKFLRRMGDVALEDGLFVFIDGHLG